MKWYGLAPVVAGGSVLLHAGHGATIADVLLGVAIAVALFALYYRLILHPHQRHERITGKSQSSREDRGGPQR